MACLRHVLMQRNAAGIGQPGDHHANGATIVHLPLASAYATRTRRRLRLPQALGRLEPLDSSLNGGVRGAGARQFFGEIPELRKASVGKQQSVGSIKHAQAVGQVVYRHAQHLIFGELLVTRSPVNRIHHACPTGCADGIDPTAVMCFIANPRCQRHSRLHQGARKSLQNPVEPEH